mgnify:CR=1 FL=1
MGGKKYLDIICNDLMICDEDGCEPAYLYHDATEVHQLLDEYLTERRAEMQRHAEAQKRRQQFSLLTASLKGIKNDN